MTVTPEQVAAARAEFDQVEARLRDRAEEIGALARQVSANVAWVSRHMWRFRLVRCWQLIRENDALLVQWRGLLALSECDIKHLSDMMDGLAGRP